MALRVWFVIVLILPLLVVIGAVGTLLPPRLDCPDGYRPGVVNTQLGETQACVDVLNPSRYLTSTLVPPFWMRLADATVLNPFIYGLIAFHILIAVIIYTPITIFWIFIGFPLNTVRAYYGAIAAWDTFQATRRIVKSRLFPGKTDSGESLEDFNNLGSAAFVPETLAEKLLDWNRQQGRGSRAELGQFGPGPFAWQTDKHVLVLASSGVFAQRPEKVYFKT